MFQPDISYDREVAAWIPTVNPGVPMWEALGENARVYWREAYERYKRRIANRAGGRGANGA